MKTHGTPFILIRMARAYGGIHWRRLPLFALHILRYILTLPLYLVEAQYKSSIEQTRLPPGAVIILGHYRSGTSFVQRLLSNDRQYAYVTNMEVVFPYLPGMLFRVARGLSSLLARAIPFRYRHINNTRIRMEDPMEEEFALAYHFNAVTPYWAFCFPHAPKSFKNRLTFLSRRSEVARWQDEYLSLLKRTCLHQGSKMLLLKSPPNTARIPLLLEMFPDARFIYCHRDPYDTFRSMVQMTRRIQTSYGLQSEYIDCDDIIEYYVRLISKYQEDKLLIPDHRLVEIDYKSLISDPERAVDHLYSKLKLNITPFDRERISAFIKKNREYRPYDLSPVDLDRDTFMKKLRALTRAPKIVSLEQP